MSGTFQVLSPTACYVDATGIHAPTFAEILSYLQLQMQDIYKYVRTGTASDGSPVRLKAPV